MLGFGVQFTAQERLLNFQERDAGNTDFPISFGKMELGIGQEMRWGQPLNAALSGSSSILTSPWGRFCVPSVGNKSILGQEEKGFVLPRILITLGTLESQGTK